MSATLGRFPAGLCTILNPEAIVLDSALGGASEYLAHGIREAIDRNAAPAAAEHVAVVPGKLPDAELAGAVSLARHR